MVGNLRAGGADSSDSTSGKLPPIFGISGRSSDWI